ncbi:MAG: hypothetical protein F6K50_27095 [Moorea sp. SIO3I7]|uniref:hypothetical protein n=1 Tax=unclassified Moorena TaxID=2683338 RepID=UPI0013BBCAD6|nr:MULTISPECIES: hypothetical protein [unclassified Moorena]NEN99025.1 hypothetical protein [Moorena sp. SIO3I7]NEO10368.1 hypothetical protein [Moorena sp. SIO3I8]NEP26107.1 hypothetical protein [Moorena sp. SIO3I6]NEQ82064.1 hypothetical protein [Moorena sp. SIO2I5]
MPLPIYPSNLHMSDYRKAEKLYDEAMKIADTDKTTAIDKLREAEGLLISCDETNGLKIVREEIKKRGG